MNRKEITEFLSNLLIRDRFSGMGKYWASEVTIDYGTKDVKRVDFMQFVPEGQCSVSDIEKGIFIGYEIKSCKQDVYSGNGLILSEKKLYSDNDAMLQGHITGLRRWNICKASKRSSTRFSTALWNNGCNTFYVGIV